MYFSDEQNYDPKKPWITWIIWEAIFIVVNFGLIILAGFFITPHNLSLLNTLTSYTIEITMIIVSLLINKMYAHQPLKFNNWSLIPGNSAFISVIWYWYLYMCITSFIKGGCPWHFFGLAFLVGICEELIFRGILLTSLIRNLRGHYAIFWGVILSSIMFGCAHSINFLNQPLKNTLIQMTYTTLLGMIFACVYLRTGNLFYPMTLHMMLDLTSMSLTSTTTSTVAQWSSITPIFVITVVILITQLRPKCIKQMNRDFRFNSMRW